jgi:hypothetical protein
MPGCAQHDRCLDATSAPRQFNCGMQSANEGREILWPLVCYTRTTTAFYIVRNASTSVATLQPSRVLRYRLPSNRVKTWNTIDAYSAQKSNLEHGSVLERHPTLPGARVLDGAQARTPAFAAKIPRESIRSTIPSYRHSNNRCILGSIESSPRSASAWLSVELTFIDNRWGERSETSCK